MQTQLTLDCCDLSLLMRTRSWACRRTLRLACLTHTTPKVHAFHALQNQQTLPCLHAHVQLGVPEDPVTGSAHAVLGPYWSPRLGKGRGRGEAPLRARQCSKRGGDLEVCVLGEEGSVLVRGAAVVVLRGRLALPA